MDAMTWAGPLVDNGNSIDLSASGNVVIGGTAEEPPYPFLAHARRQG